MISSRIYLVPVPRSPFPDLHLTFLGAVAGKSRHQHYYSQVQLPGHRPLYAFSCSNCVYPFRLLGLWFSWFSEHRKPVVVVGVSPPPVDFPDFGDGCIPNDVRRLLIGHGLRDCAPPSAWPYPAATQVSVFWALGEIMGTLQIINKL